MINFRTNVFFVKNQSESHFSIWSHLLTFDARDKLTSGACLCFETHVKKICFSFFRKIIGQYKKIKVVGNPNLRWELNLPKVLTGQPPIPPAKKTFYSNFWSLCFKIHLVHDYVKSCKMLSFFLKISELAIRYLKSWESETRKTIFYQLVRLNGFFLLHILLAIIGI